MTIVDFSQLDDTMCRLMFMMLLELNANCPFCHCGEEPYTDGVICPTCQALYLKEQFQDNIQSQSVTESNDEGE